jgi:hypothetical protein
MWSVQITLLTTYHFTYYFITLRSKFRPATPQAVSRRLLTAEARVRGHVNPRGAFDGQSDTGTGFSPSPFFYRPYHSTDGPYSLICHLGMDNGPFQHTHRQCHPYQEQLRWRQEIQMQATRFIRKPKWQWQMVYGSLRSRTRITFFCVALCMKKKRLQLIN